jgi:predicted RNase H-like HicB family nuclease
MRFSGQVQKAGRYWAIDVPILGVVTQGRTRKEAYEMIADAVESLVNKSGFHVEVFPGDEGYFEIGSPDVGALTALLLRRQRVKSGLSQSEVSQRMGSRSLNSYARYEQGRSVPSVGRLSLLLSAVTQRGDFVINESHGRGGV